MVLDFLSQTMGLQQVMSVTAPVKAALTLPTALGFLLPITEQQFSVIFTPVFVG